MKLYPEETIVNPEQTTNESISSNESPKTQHAAVVGAGIAGLSTAMALSRQGYQVTLIERDIPPPPGDVDQAFFDWQRRGAAQFRHPHAFLGLMCSLLETHYPDLLEDFFTTGARKVEFKDMVPPHLLDKYHPEAGDESMWMLLCRRATMETVLRQYVQRQPNVTIHNQTYVTGIETTEIQGHLAVQALQTTDRTHNNQQARLTADVFVDATGRTSKFPQWFKPFELDIEEQRDGAEIVYYTRHYQLKPGVEEPDRHELGPFAGDLGYLKYGVFPGEQGHFAVIMCLPNHETQLREAIKVDYKFDEICQHISGLKHWVSPQASTATTPPFGIGDISAVWRDYVPEGQAQVLNFFPVGDSAVRTNPLYGRGCSISIVHAHILADVLTATADPLARAKQFQEQTNGRLKPIFDASLNEDKTGIKRAKAILNGENYNKAKSIKHYLGLAFTDALGAAAREQMHVFRGVMRTVNLVEKPGTFLQDKKIKRTIMLYMLRGRARNSRDDSIRGPNRREMLELLQSWDDT